jgi:cytochrome c6
MNIRLLTAIVAILLLGAAPALTQTESAATFKQKCAMCHGEDGKGQTAMGKKMNLRDLGSAEVQKQTDEQLYDITAKGKNKMPGYETQLGSERVKALVQFMRGFAKK